MNRHVALMGAMTALALLLPATAAQAAVVVNVTSPEPDAILTVPESLPIEVTTHYDPGECPERVTVQLTDHDGDELSDASVNLQAEGACRLRFERQALQWTGASFEPKTLKPFDSGSTACNGGYAVRATTTRENQESWTGMSRFIIQLPPSAPSDVTVTTGVERATIEWSPAPEPDVTGYRIVRGDADDPDWETVVGPDVTTVEDADAPAGKHEYRVATLRADGLVEGEPVKPCTDDGQDLQTASAAVPATVDAPATESETPSESESATESETATETTSPEPTRTPTPTPEDEPEPEPEPVPAETTNPEPTEVESTDPEYDEQLDFSGVGPSSPDDDPDGGAVALDVPGGSSEMDELLGPILRPIAGGMILLVFALHLRRWSRDVW